MLDISAQRFWCVFTQQNEARYDGKCPFQLSEPYGNPIGLGKVQLKLGEQLLVYLISGRCCCLESLESSSRISVKLWLKCNDLAILGFRKMSLLSS